MKSNNTDLIIKILVIIFTVVIAVIVSFARPKKSNQVDQMQNNTNIVYDSGVKDEFRPEIVSEF